MPKIIIKSSDTEYLIAKQKNESVVWYIDPKTFGYREKTKTWSPPWGRNRKTIVKTHFAPSRRYIDALNQRHKFSVSNRGVSFEPADKKGDYPDLDKIIDWLDEQSEYIIPSLKSRAMTKIHEIYGIDVGNLSVTIDDKPSRIQNEYDEIRLNAKLQPTEILEIDGIPFSFKNQIDIETIYIPRRQKNTRTQIPQLTSKLNIRKRYEGFRDVEELMPEGWNDSHKPLCISANTTKTPESDDSVLTLEYKIRDKASLERATSYTNELLEKLDSEGNLEYHFNEEIAA